MDSEKINGEAADQEKAIPFSGSTAKG